MKLNDKKNLLVTGGCGFIGSNFINYIHSKNKYNIINLDAMYYCANKNNINTEIQQSSNYNLIKGKIPIIGVGGVDSGKSAYDKFSAGASFIQLYTGMIYQGPNIIKKIKSELKEILTKKGITNFEQIIGKNNN